MKPLISQAYEVVLHMENLTGTKLLNRASLIQDFASGNDGIANDLEQFNIHVTQVHSQINNIDLESLKEHLIYIRIYAMNIENEFSRLADSIQKAFASNLDHDS